MYRREPEGNIMGILSQRSAQAKGNSTQTQGGKSASVRNPAFVSITGRDNSCGGGGKPYDLPRNSSNLNDVYYSGGSIKPGPDIDSVTIEYGGDYGLARKITGKIRCYTMSDFKVVQRHFLLPGNEIDVSFGYAPGWGPTQTKELKNFIVATFSFSTTQEGHWICEFTAVSAATAIKNLDMQIIVCNGCSGTSGQQGNSGPLQFMTDDSLTKNAVKGVAQLIAADAQGNGTSSIENLQDGQVITSFVWGQAKSKKAAIVIFSGDHTKESSGKFFDWLWSKPNPAESEVDATNNNVYVSLAYIVNRIINDQLLPSMGCSIPHENAKFAKLQIVFDPVYSKCKVANGITSGDPLTVLMLGNADYMNKDGDGKNFDKDCKNISAVMCNQSGDITLENILIHRAAVAKAFTDATKKRNANADHTDVKDTGDEVVSITDFFHNVADIISDAVGGAISLRLVEHPENQDYLVVVDQNYGVSDQLTCIVFDPIDGDGSTRTCTVQSNVGSQEYRAAMFVGASKKGDAMSAIRNCADKLKDQRQSEFTKAQTDKFALIKDPGNVGKNKFNGQDLNSLKSAMNRMYKNNPNTERDETVHYPGLSIELEIDGVWGLIPGNAISSTQVPVEWREQYKSYFMVVKVVHTIQQSDWSTSVSGVLGYYKNINYKVL